MQKQNGAPPPVQSPSPKIGPAAAFAAFGNPIRWQMIQIMAEGRKLTATEFASEVKRDIDGIYQHLGVLRDAGVVCWDYDKDDRRKLLHHIPERWRPETGVVDYGFCLLRFGK